MKKLVCLLMTSCLLAATTTGSAAEKRFSSYFSRSDRVVPRAKFRIASRPRHSVILTQNSIPPAPAGSSQAIEPTADQPIELYSCVKYKDHHNIHPCAVSKIVAVQDPCYDPCSCGPPQCVYVLICVPPCGCERIKVSRHGRKVKYDYGKYEVEIKSKRGVIYVDYDD